MYLAEKAGLTVHTLIKLGTKYSLARTLKTNVEREYAATAEDQKKIFISVILAEIDKILNKNIHVHEVRAMLEKSPYNIDWSEWAIEEVVEMPEITTTQIKALIDKFNFLHKTNLLVFIKSKYRYLKNKEEINNTTAFLATALDTTEKEVKTFFKDKLKVVDNLLEIGIKDARSHKTAVSALSRIEVVKLAEKLGFIFSNMGTTNNAFKHNPEKVFLSKLLALGRNTDETFIALEKIDNVYRALLPKTNSLFDNVKTLQLYVTKLNNVNIRAGVIRRKIQQLHQVKTEDVKELTDLKTAIREKIEIANQSLLSKTDFITRVVPEVSTETIKSTLLSQSNIPVTVNATREELIKNISLAFSPEKAKEIEQLEHEMMRVSELLDNVLKKAHNAMTQAYKEDKELVHLEGQADSLKASLETFGNEVATERRELMNLIESMHHFGVTFKRKHTSKILPPRGYRKPRKHRNRT